jgi:hypothetical protein
MAFMLICHACRRKLVIEKSVGRRDECPFCGADLHCCFNCKFYDRTAPKQCKEPMAELVNEKEKANFCDYLVFMESMESSVAGTPDAAAEQTRKALDDLFKK